MVDYLLDASLQFFRDFNHLGTVAGLLLAITLSLPAIMALQSLKVTEGLISAGTIAMGYAVDQVSLSATGLVIFGVLFVLGLIAFILQTARIFMIEGITDRAIVSRLERAISARETRRNLKDRRRFLGR